jgi:hypothetical protein
MTQVSRPVQVLLLLTVLFAAVWFAALRPKSPTAGGVGAPAAQSAPTAPGVKGLTTAIDKAHGAVATANAAGERAAGTPVAPVAGQQRSTAPAGSTPARPATHAHARSTTATHAHARSHHGAPAHTHRHAAKAAPDHVRLVAAALRHHKAIAIAFVDPAAADSRAVAGELRHVGSFHGRALVLVVPIGQLSRYGVITRQVQITTAPTTVVVARNGAASTIVGFADRFEVEQRLADALASKR